MPIQLYDTQTRSLQALLPEAGEPFRFYCCGPTVYGPAHIGNFRTFLIQDTLRRILEVEGFSVQHVRNLTDLDDKTIRGAQKAGLALRKFTEQWTQKFHADCDALNCLRPSAEPSAVEHIPEQIALIKTLIEKENAYATKEGSVYFRVASFDKYGQLTQIKQEELQTQAENSGGAVNDADEYDRETVRDFALWKSHKTEDGENFWQSPWGKGRPGWHLECSAMIESAFGGKTIDLHGGGIDLCFPHHENEIAQSECAHDRALCKHWFHSAHLMVDGAKMSKSLGNLYTLDDLRAKGFNPIALRYALIAGSYRQQLNFTLDTLHAAQSALTKLERFASALLAKRGQTSKDMDAYILPQKTEDLGRFQKAWDALSHNLNTPAALGAIFGVIGSNPVANANSETAKEMLHQFGSILYALGLRLFTVEKPALDIPKEILDLAEDRLHAKQSKDYAKADALRDALLSQGWIIKDTAEGFELEPK